MSTRARWLAAAMVSVVIAGCSAYDSRYEFYPRPFEVGHMIDGRGDRAASVLVTILGVRKADVELHVPASVELRMRVDNETDEPVHLDPASLRLFAANLAQFPPPEVPGGPLVVEPNGSGVLTAYFPFPEGKVPGPFDLSGLSTRWTLDIADERSTGSATFSYDEDDGYYDRGYYPWGFGWGYSSWWNGHDHDHGHDHGHGHGGSGHGGEGSRGDAPFEHPGARMQSGPPGGSSMRAAPSAPSAPMAPAAPSIGRGRR